MALPKMCFHVGKGRRPVVTDLAHVGHLPGLMIVLHVLQQNVVCLKGQVTDSADRSGVRGSVHTVNVTLQLEGGGELAVAVLAGGVGLPAVVPLPLEFQVMFGMIHKLDVF